MARIRSDVRYELRTGAGVTMGFVTVNRSEGNWLVAVLEPSPAFEEHRLLFQELEEAIKNKWKARLDDFEERIDALALELVEAIVALPKDPQLRAMLARAWRNLGKPRKAVKAAKAGLALKPSDPDSIEELALAWVARGYPKEARAVLRAGLELNPKHEALTRRLAHESLDDLPVAEALYRSLVTPECRDWRTFNGLGSALEHQGKLRAAITAYEIAEMLDPDESLPPENLKRARVHPAAGTGPSDPQLEPIHARLRG